MFPSGPLPTVFGPTTVAECQGAVASLTFATLVVLPLQSPSLPFSGAPLSVWPLAPLSVSLSAGPLSLIVWSLVPLSRWGPWFLSLFLSQWGPSLSPTHWGPSTLSVPSSPFPLWPLLMSLSLGNRSLCGPWPPSLSLSHASLMLRLPRTYLAA